ncbi:MAG: hypothetical protein ACUZ8E_17950 [Candidatus Anammoxibacter sp.]
MFKKAKQETHEEEVAPVRDEVVETKEKKKTVTKIKKEITPEVDAEPETEVVPEKGEALMNFKSGGKIYKKGAKYNGPLAEELKKDGYIG